MNTLWEARKRLLLFGLPWTFTKYKLNEDRFFVRTGLFNLKEDEVRLYRILDVQLKRSFGQRIFGLGTIVVHSSDRSLGDFEIKNIKDSVNVKELLSEAIEEQRVQKRVVNREFMVDDDLDSDEDF